MKEEILNPTGKYIICDTGPADWGKTETLLKVIDILSMYYKPVSEIRTNGNDRWDKFIISSGRKVVVSTQGDPNSLQTKWLKQAVDVKADIIVTTCRTSGDTVETIYDFAKEYEYEIIWFRNFHCDVTAHFSADSMKYIRCKEAQALVDILHVITS